MSSECDYAHFQLNIIPSLETCDLEKFGMSVDALCCTVFKAEVTDDAKCSTQIERL